jgi:uncharacterized protein (TIGR03067 family)
MKTLLLGTLLLPLAGAGPAAEVEEEIKKLNGYWKIVRSVQDGEEQSKAEIKDMVLFLESPSVVVYEKDSVAARFSFEVRPKLAPKGIDFLFTEGDKKGQRDRGIYRLEGKKLEICIQEGPKGDRPKTFTSEKGSKMSLIVLEKIR